jgi:murein L,D-transpeptidase YcbB/YkuD
LDAWEFEEKMEESEKETTKRKFDKSEVEEFVASLGPQQYEFLRKQNNLLDENVKIENIHETEKVPETVLQLGIENDFFRFVEKILLREIFVRFKENKECQTPNVNVNQNNYLKDDFFALNVLYGG